MAADAQDAAVKSIEIRAHFGLKEIKPESLNLFFRAIEEDMDDFQPQYLDSKEEEKEPRIVAQRVQPEVLKHPLIDRVKL